MDKGSSISKIPIFVSAVSPGFGPWVDEVIANGCAQTEVKK
jgi:hypothetical protein